MITFRAAAHRYLSKRFTSSLASSFDGATSSGQIPTAQQREEFARQQVDFDAWINNKAVSLSNEVDAKAFSLVDPSTEEVYNTKFSSLTKLETAVQDSVRVFPAWSKTPGAQRAEVLRKIANGIREHAKQLIALEALNVGKPVPEAEWDVQDAASCFEYMADLACASPAETRTPLPHVEDHMLAESTYMPLGPVAVIVPWNYPLLMAVWKVAPALAAGCTVVLKPSEYTPLTALRLGKIAAEAGLPPGVLNVVSGGPEVGAALAADGRFGKIAFTGSSRAGRAVMAAAAPNTTPVSLELGGKSSSIVFADAVDSEEKLTAVAEWVLFGVFWTNGQICSATSRLLVQDCVYEKLLAKLQEGAASIKMGDPFDESTKLGPVVNRAQFEQVVGYARRAAGRKGIRALCGIGSTQEHERAQGQGQGFFVPPTIFADVQPTDEAWQNEIFGPVLCAAPFKHAEDAIASANETAYGLGAAVFTEDDAVWQQASQELRAGVIWRNCSQPCYAQTPW